MFPTLIWMIDLKAQLHEAASASGEERIRISFNIMPASFTKNPSKLLVGGGRVPYALGVRAVTYERAGPSP